MVYEVGCHVAHPWLIAGCRPGKPIRGPAILAQLPLKAVQFLGRQLETSMEHLVPICKQGRQSWLKVCRHVLLHAGLVHMLHYVPDEVFLWQVFSDRAEVCSKEGFDKRGNHAHRRHTMGGVLIAGHLRQFHPGIYGAVIVAPSLRRNLVSFLDSVRQLLISPLLALQEVRNRYQLRTMVECFKRKCYVRELGFHLVSLLRV